MPRRSNAVRRGHLAWRVRLFSGAALLAMIGIARGMSWLIWVALGLLLLGFFLRFAPEPGGAAEEEDGEAGEIDEPQPGAADGA